VGAHSLQWCGKRNDSGSGHGSLLNAGLMVDFRMAAGSDSFGAHDDLERVPRNAASRNRTDIDLICTREDQARQSEGDRMRVHQRGRKLSCAAMFDAISTHSIG
jgi:hypothetical protein